MTDPTSETAEALAACAHQRVTYQPLDNADGTQSERWLCTDCATEFKQRFWLTEATTRATTAERALADLTSRLTTIIDEAFGLQPVMPADELLTTLERLLYDRRVEAERALAEKEAALSRALDVVESSTKLNARLHNELADWKTRATSFMTARDVLADTVEALKAELAAVKGERDAERGRLDKIASVLGIAKRGRTLERAPLILDGEHEAELAEATRKLDLERSLHAALAEKLRVAETWMPSDGCGLGPRTELEALKAELAAVKGERDAERAKLTAGHSLFLAARDYTFNLIAGSRPGAGSSIALRVELERAVGNYADARDAPPPAVETPGATGDERCPAQTDVRRCSLATGHDGEHVHTPASFSRTGETVRWATPPVPEVVGAKCPECKGMCDVPNGNDFMACGSCGGTGRSQPSPAGSPMISLRRRSPDGMRGYADGLRVAVHQKLSPEFAEMQAVTIYQEAENVERNGTEAKAAGVLSYSLLTLRCGLTMDQAGLVITVVRSAIYDLENKKPDASRVGGKETK